MGLLASVMVPVVEQRLARLERVQRYGELACRS